MRFLVFGLFTLVALFIVFYLLGKRFIDNYLKYYRLGLTCFDKKSRTFNDVLDYDIIASEEISKLDLMAYTKGKQSAKTKYLAAQKRYEDYVRSSS